MEPIKRMGEREYIPECDRKKKPEKQTKVVLYPLNVEERMMLTFATGNTGDKSLLTWDLAVKELKNFGAKFERDEDEPCISKTGKHPWKRGCFEYISDNFLFEVAMEVMNTMNLTEAELKN